VLDAVLANSRQLLTFVNNLLSEALLSNNTLTVKSQPIVVSTLVNQSVGILIPLIRRKGLDVQVMCADDLPERIMGDNECIRQVVLNLLDNAIKFTEQGVIRVLVTADGSNTWTIQVSDTGRGIAPDQISQIFERFYQGDGSITREVNRGIGMGLSIVKQLAALMRGEIVVDSVLDRGTTFTVTLPLERAPEKLASHLQEVNNAR
jgi:signal transduction histidine kinase